MIIIFNIKKCGTMYLAKYKNFVKIVEFRAKEICCREFVTLSK